MRNGKNKQLIQSGHSAKVVRCAIYTRKSTDEGLNQDFNSLDAQREADEAFILSPRGEGGQALPHRFDDGGFMGGNMDRPALKRVKPRIIEGRYKKSGETPSSFTIVVWGGGLFMTVECKDTRDGNVYENRAAYNKVLPSA